MSNRLKLKRNFRTGTIWNHPSISVGVGVGVVLAAPIAFIYAGIWALGVVIFSLVHRTEALALVHHDPVSVNISEPNMVSMFLPSFFVCAYLRVSSSHLALANVEPGCPNPTTQRDLSSIHPIQRGSDILSYHRSFCSVARQN